MNMQKIMDEKQINLIIQESIDSLFRSELISDKVTITNETILLGKGSVLDSVAFITLFSEIEDRLTEKTGTEVFIDFNKLHDFNTDKSQLNVITFIEFINSLINPEK